MNQRLGKRMREVGALLAVAAASPHLEEARLTDREIGRMARQIQERTAKKRNGNLLARDLLEAEIKATAEFDLDTTIQEMAENIEKHHTLTKVRDEPVVEAPKINFDIDNLPEFFNIFLPEDDIDNVAGRTIYLSADTQTRLYVQLHPKHNARIVALQTLVPHGMTEEFGGWLLGIYGKPKDDPEDWRVVDAHRYVDKQVGGRNWYSTTFLLKKAIDKHKDVVMLKEGADTEGAEANVAHDNA